MTPLTQASLSALQEAKRAFKSGDLEEALNHLELIAPTDRTAAVVRLHCLCLMLLDRHKESHKLVAIATALNPAYPFVTLISADLAWHRREYWAALIDYLESVNQQPRLDNLWHRIIAITEIIAAQAGPLSANDGHQEHIPRLIMRILDQLEIQPENHLLLKGLSCLLPIMPADVGHPRRHLLISGCCHQASVALRALDKMSRS